MRALLWPAATIAAICWALLLRARLSRLRKANAVAVTVIAHWRRMAMNVRIEGGKARYLTREELAEKIATSPLTNEQQAMVRGVLRERRNQRRRP